MMIDTPVFILSSGRCGSTLMQRTLNSYADITIWGEHNGFLRDMANGFFSLLGEHKEAQPRVLKSDKIALHTSEDLARFTAADKWQGLMNCFDEQDVVNHFRTLVRSMLVLPVMEQGHIWGFKEIRYGLDDRVIEFLHRLFPQAHFVFLVRNGLNTIASKAVKFYTGEGRRNKLGVTASISRGSMAWRKQYLQFRNWHGSGILNSHWIAFEDLIQSVDVLAPLLSDLGKEIGDEQRSVLAMTEGRGASNVSGGVNDRSRFLNYPQLVLAQWSLGDLNAALGYPTPLSVGWVASLRKLLGRNRALLEAEKV